MSKNKKKKKALTRSIAPKSSRDTLPEELRLDLTTPGIHLGRSTEADYIGIPQGTEGNLLVIGSHGSGKTQGIAMPTLATCESAAFVIDIKGELSAEYRCKYQAGCVRRQYLIFDPSDISSMSYDPLWWLTQDGEANLVSNIVDMAQTIIPTLPAEPEPFWTQAEQQTLAAAMLYFYRAGLSFSEVTCKILSMDVQTLCKELSACDDVQVRMLIGNVNDNPKLMASIDRGLRSHLTVFAADPCIAHALRGERESAQTFTWDALENAVVFLRIPQDKLDVWAPVIKLMVAQLIRFLERRPEKYSEPGSHIVPILLLLDEFPRLGKLPMLANAMATLRSKNVNIALFAQSLAQIDCIYGEAERRVIVDNCPYIAIFRAHDADTQHYLVELIGTRLREQHSLTEQLDRDFRETGYSWRTGEVREHLIQSYELATLDDILLLSPYGFFRVEKAEPKCGIAERKAAALLTAGYYRPVQAIARENRINECPRLLSVQERVRKADVRIAEHRMNAQTALERLRQEHDVDQFLAKLQPESIRGVDEPAHQRTAYLADLVRDPSAAKWLRDREKRKSSDDGVIVPYRPDNV